MATMITVPADVLFRFNSDALSDYVDDLLGEPLRFLLRHPSAVMVVVCHTDADGDEGYNQTLSERRARAVARWFEDHGVNPACISFRGYGSERPVESSSGSVDKSQTRRVELIVEPRPNEW